VPDRVVPVPTELTKPYWAAAARGELRIQRCASCRRFVHFPEPCCPGCGSPDLSYDQVSGLGSVSTFAVVHRSFVPGPPTPYTIAWIELVEQPGLRVFGNVLGAPPAQLRIGDRVEVVFEELPGFGPVPNFRLSVPTDAA
jgi:uncharacterized protein